MPEAKVSFIPSNPSPETAIISYKEKGNYLYLNRLRIFPGEAKPGPVSERSVGNECGQPSIPGKTEAWDN